MREQERPSLVARVLFKSVDRLSGHNRPMEDDPLQHRQSTGRTAIRPHFQKSPRQRRASSYQPPPLIFTHMPPRTRCLTPPPIERKSEICPKTDEQTRSLLFTLPKEILLLIYKEVVGNRLIHIIRRPHQLSYTICKANGDLNECREEQCRGLKLPNGMYAQTSPGNGNIIQLLQTCRKIYVDAIYILYSSNIFDFDSMEGLISMSCALLPQRFDSIQSLRIDFRFNLSFYFTETTCFNDWPRWERTWRILASMGALQRLWMHISWPKPALYDSEEKRYLEPLWILTHMKIFEVSLPPLKEKEKDWDKWHKDAPFKIIRRSVS